MPIYVTMRIMFISYSDYQEKTCVITFVIILFYSFYCNFLIYIYIYVCKCDNKRIARE